MWATYDISDAAPLTFEDGSLVLHCDQSSNTLHNNILTESHRIESSGLHNVTIFANSLDSKNSNFSLVIYAYFKDSNDNLIEGPIELERFQFSPERSEIAHELNIPEHVKRLVFKIYLSRDHKSKVSINHFIVKNGQSCISMLDSEIYYGTGKIFNPQADLKTIEVGNLNNQSAAKGLLGRFIGVNGQKPIETSSVIKLSEFESFSDYFSSVKKIARKSAIYPARLAGRKGYFTSPFFQSCYLDDYLDINESSGTRQGKAMSSSYLRTDSRWKNYEIERTEDVIELNKSRYPRNAEIFDNYKGELDWGLHFGAFIPSEGHKQGEFQVNEKLVGYLYVRRFGDIAAYSYIIGHSEHLRNGIMYQMHFDMIEMIFNTDNEFFNGINFIFYSGHYQGESKDGIKTWGLRRWKEKLLFEPTNLQTGQIFKDQCDISILKSLADSLNLEYEEDSELLEVLISEKLIK